MVAFLPFVHPGQTCAVSETLQAHLNEMAELLKELQGTWPETPRIKRCREDPAVFWMRVLEVSMLCAIGEPPGGRARVSSSRR